MLSQTWGFEVVEGQQRYTRHVLFTGPKGEVIKARMTYDYHGTPRALFNLSIH
jgi:hypothetical protein